MFQFRAFPAYDYFVHRTLSRYCRDGFPHSEISGSMRMCRSPELIAACRVLLRLLMPRHSPCALISLTCRSDPLADLTVYWFSLRIMQVTEVRLHCSFVTQFHNLSLKQHFRAVPSVALLLLPFPLFSFQGADPRSKTGSKRSKAFKRFDPFSGGDKRDRTADLLRAKQALSQLSYTPIGNWWALVGSNHRPYDYQSYALAS